MADNVHPSDDPNVATDDIGGGVQAQRVKLLDATDGSSAATGVAANPFITSDTVAQRTTIALTGPSNDVWGEDIDCRGAQWVVLRVESMDTAPGAQIVAWGAPAAGGDYNQKLEWIVPDGENDSSVQRFLDPTVLLDGVSTTVNFAYIATPPPFLRIVGSNSFGSAPVVAWLDLYPFPGPVVRTLTPTTPISWGYASSATTAAHVPLNAFTEDDVAGTARLITTTAVYPHYLLDGVAATGAGSEVEAAASMHGLQVTTTGSPSAVVVTLEGTIDDTNWVTVATWDSATQTSGDIVWAGGKPVYAVRGNLTTLTGGTSPTVTAVWAAGEGGGGSDGGGSSDTELTTKDYDTGGGTDTVAVAGILLPKSGGAVAGGTSSDPLRTDPTGSTAQPVTDNGGSLTVDGTVAATQSGTWNVGTVTTVTNVVHVDDNSSTLSVDDGGGSLTVDAASLPLPTGAATAAKQPALGTAGTASADVITVQGIASGTTLPVTVASARAEDAAHVSGDTGAFILAVRQSEANSLTSTAGSDGDYAAVNADARGLLQVVARPYVSRIRVASASLTTTSPAYTIGDQAGTLMTFAGCARVSAGTGTILAAMLLDKGDVGSDYRLHIYRSSVTLSGGDNGAWSVSDSDQQELIGIVTMPSMLDVGANRVSTLANIGLPYDCAATSLFVGIETRTANAVYAAATDLNLVLTVCLD